MKYLMVLLLAALTFCGGCAVFNRDNTPTLNWLEDKVMPKKNPAKILSYPVMIPAGLAAVAIDGLLIRPVTVFDDAMRDTRNMCWTNSKWDEQYVTECVLLPFRVVGTPFVAVTSFALRWVFDIPPNDPAAKDKKEPQPPQPATSPDEAPGWVKRRGLATLTNFFAVNDGGDISADILSVGEPPGWLGRNDEYGQKIVSALRRDSWIYVEKQPGAARPADSLCWIVLQGRSGSLIVHVGREGLTVGPDRRQRFVNASLAGVLQEVFKARGLLTGPSASRWREALDSAAAAK